MYVEKLVCTYNLNIFTVYEQNFEWLFFFRMRLGLWEIRVKCYKCETDLHLQWPITPSAKPSVKIYSFFCFQFLIFSTNCHSQFFFSFTKANCTKFEIIILKPENIFLLIWRNNNQFLLKHIMELYESSIYSSITPCFLGKGWNILNISWGICIYYSPGVVHLSYLNSPAPFTEKAMVPHSSTLAWKSPWREEPGRLQSMGSRRVGHDCVTSLPLFTFMYWKRKWQLTSVFLPGESQGRGSLVGCRLWGRTESDTTEVT